MLSPPGVHGEPSLRSTLDSGAPRTFDFAAVDAECRLDGTHVVASRVLTDGGCRGGT